MYIKEFEKEALGQITEEITEGEPRWEGYKNSATGMTVYHKLAKDNSSSLTVDFDLAITVEDEKKGKAGLHVDLSGGVGGSIWK